MEQEKPPFEDVVEAWRDSQDGSYVPRNRDDRKRAFMNLFDTLLDYGYTREDILFGPNKAAIISYSYNPHHKDKDKKEKWRKMVEEDFKRAQLAHDRMTPNPIVIKEYDESKANYQAPPAKPYKSNLEAIQEQSAKEPQQPAPEKPESDEEIEDPKLIPQKEWEKLPSVELNSDEDMLKLLGYKDE